MIEINPLAKVFLTMGFGSMLAFKGGYAFFAGIGMYIKNWMLAVCV